MAIALLALAGLLVGGAWALYQQGSGRAVAGMTAALGALAAAGGLLWL